MKKKKTTESRSDRGMKSAGVLCSIAQDMYVWRDYFSLRGKKNEWIEGLKKEGCRWNIKMKRQVWYIQDLHKTIVL